MHSAFPDKRTRVEKDLLAELTSIDPLRGRKWQKRRFAPGKSVVFLQELVVRIQKLVPQDWTTQGHLDEPLT